MEYFHEQIEKLEQLGIAKNGQLTELGKNMSQWIGRADIAYATHLQYRFIEGASSDEVLLWIVATALSNTSAASLKAQHSYFVDYNGEHNKMTNRIDVWSGSRQEDIAIFRVLSIAHKSFPGYLWHAKQRSSLTERRFRSWASWSGIDARKLTRATQAIADTMKLFVKINEKNEEFSQTFQSATLSPDRIRWDEVLANLDIDEIERSLSELTGSTRVRVARESKAGPFEWQDEKHGHKGIINQDDTPVQLIDGGIYTARVVPSRESKTSEASWRLTSLGFLQMQAPPRPAYAHAEPAKTTVSDYVPGDPYQKVSEPQPLPKQAKRPLPWQTTETPPAEPVEPPRKKKSFWGNLFGL